MASLPSSDRRTQIIVAVIGLIGVLGTTAIANFPQLLEVFGISVPQQHQIGESGRCISVWTLAANPMFRLAAGGRLVQPRITGQLLTVI